MSDFSDSIYGVPSDVTAGWNVLGRVLAGGGALRQNAYQRGMLQGAQTADVMEQARRRRDQNVGFADITPQSVAAAQGGGPGAAGLISALIHSGYNASEAVNALGGVQKQGFSQAIFDQARGGANIAALNPELAALHGEPVKTSSVEGNTLINPYALPNQQAAQGGNVPTAVGQSDMARALAEAGQANAGAERNRAEAARAYAGIGADKAANYELVTDQSTGNTVEVNKLTHEVIPVTGPNGQPFVMGQKGGGMGASTPKPEELEQAFGKPTYGGKPNPRYAEFKTYQALHAQTDPAFNNGEYALSQYMLASQGTSMAGQGATDLAAAAKGAPVAGFSQAMDEASQGNQGAGLPSGVPTAPRAASPATLQVGQTATNPKTGERIRWNGQTWEPLRG